MALGCQLHQHASIPGHGSAGTPARNIRKPPSAYYQHCPKYYTLLHVNYQKLNKSKRIHHSWASSASVLEAGGSLQAAPDFSLLRPSPPSASEEDARFTLEALNARNRGPLQQIPTGGRGAQADNNPRKAGLRPSNFNPRESVKEALLGNVPRNTMLSRLLATNRKQYKKRGNLSECFWKYCV
ncbi:urotensin-2-like [Elgaria multicarinata webbii]|uniref:urotensin-2-like n=1 Tax=Elgaria multicarinata webbii TaxID=159646 RepID=UPI002FCD2D25